MLTQPFFISVRVFYFKSPSNEFTKTCLLSVFIAKFRLVNIHSVIGFNEVWLVSYAFVRQNVCFKSWMLLFLWVLLTKSRQFHNLQTLRRFLSLWIYLDLTWCRFSEVRILMSFMKQCKQQLSQKRFHQQEKKHAVLTNREVNRTTRCWPSSYGS